MGLDRNLLVLSIIREADNALTFQTVLNRSKLQAKELEETMGLLVLDGKIRTFAGDELKPLVERRFFTVHENKQIIDDFIAGQLPLLAGEDCLYFAYGAELEPELYHSSKEIHFLMRGRLKGYRLVFYENQAVNDGGGMANLHKSSGSEVWGAVYYLEQIPKAFMDGRVRIRIPVESAVGMLAVETYLFKSHNVLYPARQYLQKLIDGGNYFGFPQNYLRQVSAMPTID